MEVYQKFVSVVNCGHFDLTISQYLAHYPFQLSNSLKFAGENTMPQEMHGMSRSPEYGVWSGMRSRCYKPKTRQYEDYGGRGITVCDRWRHSFAAFYADMGPRPSQRHTIDRIENSKGYSPDNCRWATRKEQQSNMRSNQHITHKGETLTISEWSRRSGVRRNTLDFRLKNGWPIELALTAKPRSTNSRTIMLTHGSETMSLSDWARKLGVSIQLISARRLRGWPNEKILQPT